MTARKPNGFTLVELLVVIAIIAVLAALVTPALMSARESSRRAACLSDQTQLGKALLHFEMSRGRFPGWREQIGDRRSPKTAGWAFVLLPYIERRDLYRTYGPGGPRFDSQPTESLELLVCPSDPPLVTGGTPTSYVVNTGMQDGTATPRRAADHEANGVFHDADPLLNRNKRLTKVTLGYISRGDGAAATLLLSERIEARNWTDFDGERRTGFIWQDSLNPDPVALINGASSPPAESTLTNHVRPSSYHSGGVNAVFADGHTQFLSRDAEYLVYCLMMTPNGSQSRRPDGQPVLAEFRRTAPSALAVSR